MTTNSETITNTIHISLLRILGQGGFGKVFLAEMSTQYGFTQRVAVKVLHSDYQQQPKQLTRLLDEARMLGVLNHRNIVKVYDVCEVNGQSAILMEYVEGLSLSVLLKQRALSWSQTWQVVADCALALSDAYNTKHQVTGAPLSLIHRDIKPSNLLLSSSGTVKLLDFGIAKMNGVSQSKTSTYQMGTARYMAPEQWLANQSSSSVDVYALARTALELLHGELLPRTPLDRALHDQTLLTAVQQVPSSEVPQILADAGRDLLWSMLSYDPEQRPTIAEVADKSLALAESMGVVSLRGLMAEREEFIDPGQDGDQGFESIPFNLSSAATESLLSMVQEDVEQTSGYVESKSVEYTELESAEVETPDVQGAEFHSQSRYRIVSMGWIAGVVCLGVLLSMFYGTGSLTLHENVLSERSPELSMSTDGIQEDRDVSIGEHDPSSGSEFKDVPSPLASESSVQSPQQPKPVHTVVISSLPLGAMVFINGKAAGRTLLHNIALKEGRHHLELHFGELHIARTVEVTEDIRFVWRPNAVEGTEEWSSFSP